MNAYLKEIADVCEIKKNLTFHIARHAFATTVILSNGVPIESVSKIILFMIGELRLTHVKQQNLVGIIQKSITSYFISTL